jgi:hypothetical protein
MHAEHPDGDSLSELPAVGDQLRVYLLNASRASLYDGESNARSTVGQSRGTIRVFCVHRKIVRVPTEAVWQDGPVNAARNLPCPKDTLSREEWYSTSYSLIWI